MQNKKQVTQYEFASMLNIDPEYAKSIEETGQTISEFILKHVASPENISSNFSSSTEVKKQFITK